MFLSVEEGSYPTYYSRWRQLWIIRQGGDLLELVAHVIDTKSKNNMVHRRNGVSPMSPCGVIQFVHAGHNRLGVRRATPLAVRYGYFGVFNIISGIRVSYIYFM